MNSYLIPIAQVQGASVTTIEGLEAAGGKFLQTSFAQHGAAQCGFCTPGMLISAYSFYLQREKDGAELPTRTEIQGALAGNLCRCTGYHKIVDAVEDAFVVKLEDEKK